MAKRPCRTPKCREEERKEKQRQRQQQKKQNAPDRSNIPPQARIDPKVLSSKSESERLWKWAFVGTSTAVAILENYANLKLPGASADHINSLIVRLAAVTKTLQDENQTASQ